MLSLKLFNAVISIPSDNPVFISHNGYIIKSNALWAKDKIINFYNKEKLSGNDLNKTFHKSWNTIINSSHSELFLHQIRHYISTYGSNFTNEIYIPNEVVDIPEITLKYKIIEAYSKQDIILKCLNLIESGIALKEETINDVLSLLKECDFIFKTVKTIKNKEALIKIADEYNIYPEDPVEFLRYVLFKTINQTLLIKNKETIENIKNSTFNPKRLFNQFGLIKLATIFNRFKPIFIAYKNKCPTIINKISKLSKSHHKPMIQNPLNLVTNSLLMKNELHWLDNASIFSLFKALSACHNRLNGQDSFTYRIRNGKSWTRNDIVTNLSTCKSNYSTIITFLKEKFNFSDIIIKCSQNIEYSLPTSEKMFIGNIPTGTKFFGNSMAVGVYWKNEWGAYDLDISGINLQGKVGWNSTYNQNNTLLYSGDITSAPDGAVEYLYAEKGLSPTLVCNNVYFGNKLSKYNIIIGQGDSINRDYMMNPNNLFLNSAAVADQKNIILGIFLPYNNKQCFVLLNIGAGNLRISDNSDITTMSLRALFQQWYNPISFNFLVKELGASIIYEDEEYTHNFLLESLQKDSFTSLFT
jgi:hypothetical protein